MSDYVTRRSQRSLDTFHIVSYHINWTMTSWTYSIHTINLVVQQRIIVQIVEQQKSEEIWFLMNISRNKN